MPDVIMCKETIVEAKMKTKRARVVKTTKTLVEAEMKTKRARVVKTTKTLDEIMSEFMTAMTNYYGVVSRKIEHEKELKKLQNKESELLIKYNIALLNIEKHFKVT